MDLPYSSYLECIELSASGYGGLLANADLGLPVPSCPGWSLLDLTVHLGSIHRWAAAHVRGSARTAGEPTPRSEELRAWFAAGVDDLTDALRSSAPDSPCWTLYPPGVVGTWARRQAFETWLHYWDAQRAVGIEGTIDAGLAADGVAEVVRDMFPRQLALGRQDPLPVTIELRPTDAMPVSSGRLLIGGVQSGDTGEPVAVVEARAVDMLLLLWGRRTLEQATAVWSGSESGLRTVLAAALVP